MSKPKYLVELRKECESWPSPLTEYQKGYLMGEISQPRVRAAKLQENFDQLFLDVFNPRSSPFVDQEKI